MQTSEQIELEKQKAATEEETKETAPNTQQEEQKVVHEAKPG